MNYSVIVPKNIETINFYGASLLIAISNGCKYVAIKPICDGIGLAWGAQHQKITNDPVLSSVISIIDTTGADGKTYKMLCLPLGYLNGWLLSISVNKVRPEIREALLKYQFECYRVLDAYWNKGIALNPRTVNRGNPDWLEVRQAGKLVRQEWGGVVHDFVGYAMSRGSKSAQMYYMNITKMQYQALELVKQSGDKYFRDSLDILQHSQLMSIEFAVQQALLEGMDMGLPYKDIFKFAKERALELAVPLKRLTGNARVLHIPVSQRIREVLV